jgi:hypothetical protein
MLVAGREMDASMSRIMLIPWQYSIGPCIVAHSMLQKEVSFTD